MSGKRAGEHPEVQVNVEEIMKGIRRDIRRKRYRFRDLHFMDLHRFHEQKPGGMSRPARIRRAIYRRIWRILPF